MIGSSAPNVNPRDAVAILHYAPIHRMKLRHHRGMVVAVVSRCDQQTNASHRVEVGIVWGLSLSAGQEIGLSESLAGHSLSRLP